MGPKICMSLQVIRLNRYIIPSPLFIRIIVLLAIKKCGIFKSSTFMGSIPLFFNRKKWNDNLGLEINSITF